MADDTQSQAAPQAQPSSDGGVQGGGDNLLGMVGSFLSGLGQHVGKALLAVGTGGQSLMLEQKEKYAEKEQERAAGENIMQTMAQKGVGPKEAGIDAGKMGISPAMTGMFEAEAGQEQKTREQLRTIMQQKLASGDIDKETAAIVGMGLSVPGMDVNKLLGETFKAVEMKQAGEAKMGLEVAKEKAATARQEMADKAKLGAASISAASRRYASNMMAASGLLKSLMSKKGASEKELNTAISKIDMSSAKMFETAIKEQKPEQRDQILDVMNEQIMSDENLPNRNKWDMVSFNIGGTPVRGLTNAIKEAAKGDNKVTQQFIKDLQLNISVGGTMSDVVDNYARRGFMDKTKAIHLNDQWDSYRTMMTIEPAKAGEGPKNAMESAMEELEKAAQLEATFAAEAGDEEGGD